VSSRRINGCSSLAFNSLIFLSFANVKDNEITSGQSNLTWPYSRRTWTVQLYSPGCANVHPITWFPGPTGLSIPNCMRLDRFNRFCTACYRRSDTLQSATAIPHPSKLPIRVGRIWTPSLGLPESTPKTACRSIQPFLHGSRSSDKPRYSFCSYIRMHSLTATLCGCLSKHICSLYCFVSFYMQQMIFM